MGRVANTPAVAPPELPAAGPRSPALDDTSAPDGTGGADGAGGAAYGLTVAEVLALPTLAGARVVAGERGLDRVVERLNVMEVPDILPWVKPHELLLTTCYPLRNAPEALTGLVDGLDDRGLAAVAVKLGRYLDELPAAMLARADRLALPVLLLPEHVGFDDILNQVLSEVLDRQAAALARAEEVHRALVAVVLAGGGLQEVTDELVRLVGGAVFTTTPDGRVLAAAGAEGALGAAYASGCFGAGGRLRTEEQRAGVRADATGEHVVVPVVAGSLDHGRIAAFAPGGRLDDSDVSVLERGATVAALVITKQLAVSAVEGKYRGDFLRDVLDGRLDPRRGVAHAASLGWDVDRPLVVVVAELDPDDAAPDDGTGAGRGSGRGEPLGRRPAQERFTAAWQTVVRLRDPQAPVVGFSSEVVALLPVEQSTGQPTGQSTGQPTDVERLVRDLVAQVSGDGGGGRRAFSTGVSRVVRSPEGIPAAYAQARRAVSVGRQVHGRAAVAHFDALGVFRLLSLVPDGAELRGFVEEVLGSLAVRDDPDAADLRRTLEVLLETNLNVAETARVLHFHYNTLRYRIGKLERMLGPFTTDPHLRLDVLLALQVIKMRGI